MKTLQRILIILIVMIPAVGTVAQTRYALQITPVDKQPSFIQQQLQLRNDFINKDECLMYINQLIPMLQAKGYISASVDSLYADSSAAHMHLYVGDQYKWASIHTDANTEKWLSNAGLNKNSLNEQVLDYNRLSQLQQVLLNYFENNGYPFAKIFMDNLQVHNGEVSGSLQINTGPVYHIDSIRINGNAKISTDYLQQYLDIKNGSVYNKEKLLRISNEIRKLDYVEEIFPPKFYWRSTGGIVDLYLQQKKSSQVNLIIGFLPNAGDATQKKLLITGEGLLNLKNAFGSGETIGLLWQRLQAASQRLNILYQQPYLFKSPFGLDFSLDMLKRDSSYLNFEYKLGARYAINTQQYAKLFVQQFSTIVNNIDTNMVLHTRLLPNVANVRVTNIGIEYTINTTNYIYNPVRGFDMTFITAVGNKRIKPSQQILNLKDPADPGFNFATLYDTVKLKSYQWHALLSMAKYFALGRHNRSTIKTALNGGYLANNNLYRNELFQIGGYRLLRGFDEQSQYLSQYAIGTVEYRYLVGANSYFNIFSDGGWGRNSSRGINIQYNYISAGLGLAVETKAGIFNLAWAVGKRNDSRFNLRQSKIHFGFVSYF